VVGGRMIVTGLFGF